MVCSLLKMLIMLVVHLTYATKSASPETRWAFNGFMNLQNIVLFCSFVQWIGVILGGDRGKKRGVLLNRQTCRKGPSRVCRFCPTVFLF
jgi:hypothetical protein